VATASAHVITLRWRHLFRSPAARRAVRRLCRSPDVQFAVSGRTSGGRGQRRINRTLSLRRTITLIEWASPQAAIDGRQRLDAAWRELGDVWSALLVPLQSKGTFKGATPFAEYGTAPDGCSVASLTYAQIRPTKMWRFYVESFPRTARRATAADSPMLAGVGFGDVPIRDACTFTLWPSSADVMRFAYAPAGEHGPVQSASRRDNWLSESMFVRFAVVAHDGDWSGRDPLSA
jgi:hypothetical protein